MNIEEMKQHKWIVSWSGGKDSTATIILMHENNIPIKEIIYVRMMWDENIPATLPLMTDFVDKAKLIFESWGYPVKIVKAKETAKEHTCKRYKRSKYPEKNGKCYGITPFNRRACELSGVKSRTITEFQLAHLNAEDYEMIGYAADETKRLYKLTKTKQSIMVELGIKEKDTYEICRKYSLLSPLYDLGIKRDGCFFCPNATKFQRDFLHKNYPELVKLIYEEIQNTDFPIEFFLNNWIKDYLENGNELKENQKGKCTLESKFQSAKQGAVS